jgi:hypothetical protein
MEPIIHFPINDGTFRFTLNPRGRRRYGTIEQFLQMNDGTQSTVGTLDGDIVNQNLRKSKHYKSVLEGLVSDTYLKPLGDTDQAPYICWPKSSTVYDIIEYEAGDFFTEHSDTKMNKLHYATLLIFPPALGTTAHTGGTLIIKRPDNTEFIFESSTNTQWICVAFHTGLKHECKPVISGRRVVIKTELLFTSKNALKNIIEEEPIPHMVCDGYRKIWDD